MSRKLYRWLLWWLLLGIEWVVAHPPENTPPSVVTSLERASESSTGEEGNSSSSSAAVSANGRFVAFSSAADNLVEGDTNDYGMLGAIGIDIFVYDRETGAVERVNLSSTGEQTNADSLYPNISVDGRFVAFFSYASNLVPNDSNGIGDIFVHDRQTGITERVSVSSTGEEQNGLSYTIPGLSRDGRFVVFHSHASNLVPNDTNNTADVFIHDRQTGITERVSLSSEGVEGNSYSLYGVPSDDGRFVTFESRAYNLVPDDDNHSMDIFVRDRQTGITERVSVSSEGTEGSGDSTFPDISGDGRFVAFSSYAYDLVVNPGQAPQVYFHDRLTHQTLEISRNPTGMVGNDRSTLPSISIDGRFVAFASRATTLVHNDTNEEGDVFVHDRQTELVFLVSVLPNGEQGNGGSWEPAISDDGQVVAYWSEASNFTLDTNGMQDVYVSHWQVAQSFLPFLGKP